ncbi:helix-turn-helix transcriptional regulator [Rhodovarius lipocyclicus]|uniref:helix-turn-helix transcriptional regulator n=1 Tax=Rhodovarius lipocyclicus TaxID=268410 RepID=UPI001358C85F|nr:hypothetical protein [Rhodovarius lipocyclicus]
MGDARWPQLMRADTAAEYLDVSKTTFLTTIARELQSVRISAGVVGYLRPEIDEWLDRKAGRAPSSAGDPNPWHQ